jgi:hypothetical protein
MEPLTPRIWDRAAADHAAAMAGRQTLCLANRDIA